VELPGSTGPGSCGAGAVDPAPAPGDEPDEAGLPADGLAVSVPVAGALVQAAHGTGP
jgi:hypothetical protein